MLELMEKSKKEITIEEGMLKNATNKITQFHKIAKNAVLGISLILAEIASKPKEYLENSGYSSVAEYTEEIFGYKKSYTYKLIKIAKFITIKDENGVPLETKNLIDNTIDGNYSFETIVDWDGFEYSPSQMLELIPLSKEQIEKNLKDLDSALSCKELRAIVKDIINPPIETTGTDSEESTEQESTESTEKEETTTDKKRLLQMLEICSTMDDAVIKERIIKVFQKALNSLKN